MGVPYKTPPSVGLIVTSPTALVVGVEVPTRARIHSVVITQDGNTTDAYTATLYSREAAANLQNTVVAGEDGLNYDVPHNHYKVAPTMNASGGVIEYFSEAQSGGFGLPFFNEDDVDDEHSRGQKPKLWIRLAPSGSAVQRRWVISVGLDSDFM